MSVDPALLSILRCPDEHHAELALDADEQTLTCTECGRIFPIRDGIPVLLLDEARQASTGSAISADSSLSADGAISSDSPFPAGGVISADSSLSSADALASGAAASPEGAAGNGAVGNGTDGESPKADGGDRA